LPSSEIAAQDLDRFFLPVGQETLPPPSEEVFQVSFFQARTRPFHSTEVLGKASAQRFRAIFPIAAILLLLRGKLKRFVTAPFCPVFPPRGLCPFQFADRGAGFLFTLPPFGKVREATTLISALQSSGLHSHLAVARDA